MEIRRLPGRIALAMVGTILVFVLTVGGSAVWMSRLLDREAREHASAQVGNVAAGLLEQTRLLMLDYAKWEAAVPRVLARDMDWMQANIGATAVAGGSFQVAVLWGGPFAEDFGWRAGGPAEPQGGLVDPAVLGLVERHLRRIPLNLYRGTVFFAWHEGALHVFGAARFEPDAGVGDLIARDVATPRILIGRRLTPEVVNRIGRSLVLEDFRLVREAPAGHQALPLVGADGRPVAHLAWEAPRLGTLMLRRMAVPLAAAVLLAAALVALGMHMLRRNARHLVWAEKEARDAARTDPLTGLPNRAAFHEALAPPARAGERAILFLDVNDFKRINDGIGHAAGDQVIVGLARRLRALVGPATLLARIAGDEFVLVLSGPQAEQRTRALAEAVSRSLARTFSVLGHELQVQLAMGYAVQGADGATGDDLLRQADLAMYEAKRHRSPTPVAYSAVIEQASRHAAVIEGGLRRALERGGELGLAYQPILDREGRMVRAEALARWTSPELGPVPPDRFIAVAEQAGLIVVLGRRLLQLVCQDLAGHPGLRVSLNISPLQLMAPDFVPMLTTELRQRGIDPARLEVELTERVIVDDPGLAALRIEELRNAGLSVALDDFGTGYSSVGYLEQFRFETLKIDRSFLSKIRSSPEAVEVLRGMILIARGLHLSVVCEGVETPEELALLHELGCDLAQGYHLGRPLPIAALVAGWVGQPEVRPAVA